MEDKIIKLSNFKDKISRTSFSPLLASSEVEVKAYSENLNSFKKSAPVTEQKPQTEKPPVSETKTEQPKVSTPPPPNKNNWPSDYEFNPANEQHNDYAGDNTEEMSFSESEAKPQDEEDTMSPSEAKSQAAMMINMYSAFVPPALAKMLRKDVGKVSRVMKYNSVDPGTIRKIESFLNQKNVEIAKALQLTPEQVSMLKQALSAVLERYKLSSDNPVVNLIVIIFGIAVTQFMTVTAIINAQFEQIKEIIEAKNISAPSGDEDFATPQGFFKKKIKVKEAA